MARPRKETGYTLVQLVNGEFEETFYSTAGALKDAIAEGNDAPALLFAGPSFPFAVNTQTIVTIGEAKPRKPRAKPGQLPVTAAETKRKGGRPKGSKNAPRPIVVKVTDEAGSRNVQIDGANGERIEQ